MNFEQGITKVIRRYAESNFFAIPLHQHAEDKNLNKIFNKNYKWKNGKFEHNPEKKNPDISDKPKGERANSGQAKGSKEDAKGGKEEPKSSKDDAKDGASNIANSL